MFSSTSYDQLGLDLSCKCLYINFLFLDLLFKLHLNVFAPSHRFGFNYDFALIIRLGNNFNFSIALSNFISQICNRLLFQTKEMKKKGRQGGGGTRFRGLRSLDKGHMIPYIKPRC